MSQIKGQSVFITGASSGIGYHAVNRFCRRGYDVVALVRKQQDVDELEQTFPSLKVLLANLNNEAETQAVVGEYLEEKGGVDILVNNAGFAQVGPVETIRMAQWRDQMETNFFAAVNLTFMALPYMRKKRYGRIVQISSLCGQMALPAFAPYCASKFALEAFSESLRYEVEQFGISVSIIAPGPVASNFNANRKTPDLDMITNGPYEQLFDKVARQVKTRHEKVTPAETVVDKIIAVVEEQKPGTRYRVGLPSYVASMQRLLPSQVLDRGMKSFVNG